MGKSSPIGLFDSGVGGLTVAHALHTILPSEQLIYFGDTAHLPYGDKSRETIVQYSLGITDFLLEQKCKVILIACNSASANAFAEVRAHVGTKAVVMNVIDPVVQRVCTDKPKNVGIIGTKATIDSGTYERQIRETLFSAGAKETAKVDSTSDSVSTAGHKSTEGPQSISDPKSVASSRSRVSAKIQVNSLATPLFVPMIEEGFVFDDISNAIIRSYLSRHELDGIDTLVLGCTHYPIIRNQISRFLNFEVQVYDTARIVAMAVQKFLSENDLLSPSLSGENKFYISDHTPYFEVIANMFFNEKIPLEKNNIWNK